MREHEPIAVECTPGAPGEGWQCAVTTTTDAGETQHVVRVSPDEMARWAHGRSPEELVHDSFAFLLERESAHAILPSFDLSDITTYFPAYAEEISRRSSA